MTRPTTPREVPREALYEEAGGGALAEYLSAKYFRRDGEPTKRGCPTNATNAHAVFYNGIIKSWPIDLRALNGVLFQTRIRLS